MANLNKVILMGNLTADPELRTTPKGTAVTDLRLAINRYYSGDSGERQEETTYVDVTLWGRQAETACQYLAKGRCVLVEGRLQLDTWEDRQTNQKRSKLRVVGENMQMVSGAREGQASGGNRQSPPARQSSSDNGYSNTPTRPPVAPDNFADDDIPF